MWSKDRAILTILLPIAYNFKVNKLKTRKIFTFKGIQSSKGVIHLRETGLVYNNVYPDREWDSGLKPSRHKQKRIESLNDTTKSSESQSVKTQREEWNIVP